ncbi:MAG: ribosome maturation factor RimM, partial [Burkholderiaceae bacterium]
IAVSRSEFPPLSEGEHYLSDVIGYRVVSREDIELGKVSGLRTGGDANAMTQWLEVTNETSSNKVMLIPLIDQYIDAIEPGAGIVKVDWHADW